jgi:hypothetical protein
MVTMGAALGHWALLCMCCAPLLVMQTGLSPEVMQEVLKFQGGLTPPVALSFYLPFALADLSDKSGTSAADAGLIGYALLGAAVWVALATALWFATSRRFRVLAMRGRIEPEYRPRPRRRKAAAARRRHDTEEITDVLPADDDGGESHG